MRQVVYDSTKIVHCLRPASTSTSPGCRGPIGCTCECSDCNGRTWVTVACIKCGQPSQSPMLPLCIPCDLARLAAGETADDIKREAAAKAAKETS